MSINENIIQLVLSFSQKEKTRFLKYLDLEYTDSVFVSLFSLITKSNQILTKEAIFNHIYPNESYRDDRVRLLLSRGKKIILSYLELETKSRVENLETSHLRLAKIDNQKIKSKIEIELNEVKTTYSYGLDYEIANMNSESIISKGNRAVEPKLLEAHLALDDHFFIEKLKLACNSQNYTNLSGYTYELKFLDLMVDYLSTIDLKDKSLLYLYFNTFRSIKDNDEKYFFIVFDYLKEIEIPEHRDYKEILMTLLNFSIQRLNRGMLDYRYIIFQIYKWQIESKNIYISKKMPSNTYKNIVNLALNIKEYDWTIQFIDSEKENLLSTHPHEDYQLVLAKYYYETERYEDCIQLILIARPLDALDNLLLRVLQCKAYYELDEYEKIDTIIHNAKLFLIRHKSKSYQFTIFKNFFLILKKILNNAQTKKGKENLLNEINETKALVDKPWLIHLLN